MRLLFRYLRSPEFVLAVVNFAIAVVLFGYEAIDEFADTIAPIFQALPFSPNVADGIFITVVVLMLATVMLPAAWVVLVAAILEVIDLDTSWTLVWVSLPNAVLWGFGVAFLYRVLKTANTAQARAATLSWTTGKFISLPRLQPCPHCGQPMPVEDHAKPAKSTEPAAAETGNR